MDEPNVINDTNTDLLNETMPPAETRTLESHHRERLLRESGLTDETLRRAGVFSMRGNHAGIAFPYSGEPPLVRVRLDTPQSINGDEVRYRSPKGSTSRIYIPHEVCASIMDRSKALYFVEGERKALAACQAGVPAVAGPGVFAFHDTRVREEAAREGRDEWVLPGDAANLLHGGGSPWWHSTRTSTASRRYCSPLPGWFA